jgi:hypothetical protein
VQFKSASRTSLYQGVNQCQTTLLLKRLAGASRAFNATPSQNAPSSNAAPLPQRERPNADFMAEHQQAPRLSKADNVAQQLKLFMAKRQPVCAWCAA